MKVRSSFLRANCSMRISSHRTWGFTVIEMLVVMTVVALLLSVIAPAYVRRVDHAKEVVLKQDLATLRDAIDKFYSDQGRYPKDFNELISTKYLRAIPVDPVTSRSDTWVATINSQPGFSGFFMTDVRSGAPGVGMDKTSYASW